MKERFSVLVDKADEVDAVLALLDELDDCEDYDLRANGKEIEVLLSGRWSVASLERYLSDACIGVDVFYCAVGVL